MVWALSQVSMFVWARNYSGFAGDTFECSYENMGFVNFIIIFLPFSQELHWFRCGHVFVMFEARYKVRVCWVHAFFKCEELAPFLHRCANREVQASFVRSSDRSQIGLESSESKKCSRGFEINHFCRGMFSALQLSKICYESNSESFRFTRSISDILFRPSWSLRSPELEVGVLRAARRYSVRNLRFKHMGYAIRYVMVHS